MHFLITLFFSLHYVTSDFIVLQQSKASSILPLQFTSNNINHGNMNNANATLNISNNNNTFTRKRPSVESEVLDLNDAMQQRVREYVSSVTATLDPASKLKFSDAISQYLGNSIKLNSLLTQVISLFRVYLLFIY